MLLVFFASANHDEDQFRDAERFDIDREGAGHVAFGHGIHFCLGASLARLEARVAFETLFSRCRNLKLAGGSVPMLDSLVLRGPKSLPLSVSLMCSSRLSSSRATPAAPPSAETVCERIGYSFETIPTETFGEASQAAMAARRPAPPPPTRMTS